MGRTAHRPKWDGPYPGTNVTPDEDSDSPGLAPQVIVPPALSAAPTFNNLPQRLLANPTTGEVSFPNKWKTDRNTRRRSSWRANTLTADFRSNGGEGAITFAGTNPGAASNQLTTFPRVRLTSGAAVGDSKTAATGFGLFRFRWDATAGFWIQTVTFINCRYYLALTSASLDQVAPANIGTALGAGGDALVWCLDGQTFGNLNWRCITWDGTTLTTTDTGIDASGSANTAFMPSFEIDTDAAVARYGLYNRGTGVDHGIVETRAFAPAVADVFGLEAVVQVTAGAAALSLDVSEFWCEHAP